MLADQLVDPGGQILNAHMAVEVRIFSIQIRQHVLHPQVKIVSSFEIRQAAQQAHRLGLVDTNAKQEQQVVRAGFLHHDPTLIQVFRYQRGRDPTFLQLTQFVHPRRQNGDLDRIQVHMIAVGLAKAMPVVVRVQRPALRLINLFRLPDIEEPGVTLGTQALHSTTKMQGSLHGAVNHTPPRITTQHRCSGFHRSYNAVMRRSGGVHHVGFVKGVLVIIPFNVDHRSLREGSQQLVGRLSFIDHLARDTIATHAALAVINRVEIGIRHPGRIEVDRRYVQRLLDVIGVIQQAIIGGVGDHRMHRPAGVGCVCHSLGNAVAGKFALGNTA